jgi:hypothetical protein
VAEIVRTRCTVDCIVICVYDTAYPRASSLTYSLCYFFFYLRHTLLLYRSAAARTLTTHSGSRPQAAWNTVECSGGDAHRAVTSPAPRRCTGATARVEWVPSRRATWRWRALPTRFAGSGHGGWGGSWPRRCSGRGDRGDGSQRRRLHRGRRCCPLQLQRCWRRHRCGRGAHHDVIARFRLLLQ